MTLKILIVQQRADPGAVRLTLRSLARAAVDSVLVVHPAACPTRYEAPPKVREIQLSEIPSHFGESEWALLLEAGCVVPQDLTDRLASVSQPTGRCHPLLSNDCNVDRVPPQGACCDDIDGSIDVPAGRPTRGKPRWHALFCESSWLTEQGFDGVDSSSEWLHGLQADSEVLDCYVYRPDPSLSWPRRAFVSAFYSGATRWDPKPALWEIGRDVRRKVARLRQTETETHTHGAKLEESYFRMFINSRREKMAAPPRSGSFKVTYVLQDLLIAGGVLSVIQLVNELNLRGVDARIAAWFEDPKVYRWLPLLRRPMIFSGPDDLARNLPQCDLAVATFWTTAQVVRKICDRSGASGAYFVQAYEADFYPKSAHTRASVVASYELLQTRIVKSNWLAAKLAQHGCETQKIPLGMDLDLFRPESTLKGAPLVLALARPDVAWAEFDGLIEALRRVKAADEGIQVVLFGADNLALQGIPFAYEDLGIIADRTEMVRWYQKAAVLVDLSSAHGFGRCGLEAMACGTPAVLSATGGVGEYAIHGRNALLVDSADAMGASEAILNILRDLELARRLAEAGLETASDYDVVAEGQRTHKFFRSLLD